MRAALVQLSSSYDPAANLPTTLSYVRQAAEGGADLVLTPEVTNCVSTSRAQQESVLAEENADQTLAALQEAARTHKIWLSIGSLALKTVDPDGRFANRSFLIGPDGQIVARYDKMHMFDVTVSATESYRESAGYRPGEAPVLARTPLGQIGLTICYDLRFPGLFRRLAQAGAEVILVPSAFSPATGKAHWETLLRARAIETGCYILAAAQTGQYACQTGKARATYGHSLAVDPWGTVLSDMGDNPGVNFVEIALDQVADARQRIPSLQHDRPFGDFHAEN